MSMLFSGQWCGMVWIEMSKLIHLLGNVSRKTQFEMKRGKNAFLVFIIHSILTQGVQDKGPVKISFKIKINFNPIQVRMFQVILEFQIDSICLVS